MLEHFYSKSGITLQRVAEELLICDLGERIPKISDLAEKFQVGRGTIQTSLKKLEEADCIKLESRGHLGTFLREKDTVKLLQYSGLERIIGVMPLPYSKKYEGLATGMTAQFEQLSIPLNMAFMQGAHPRLEGVKEGRYDFAIVSKFSALHELNNNEGVILSLSFGPQTYLSSHAVIFSDEKAKQIEDGMKIGVDKNSLDQQILTNAEAEGKKVEFVQLNYMHLLDHLKANTIDATVWNIDEIGVTPFNVQPLTSETALSYETEMTEAVVVIREDNKKLDYILNLLSLPTISEVQAKVENGDLIPKY
ncbi:GntR family transcriptional regulator YhfZ [Halalkalibacterium halodurans]|uniref:Helix-turn-helix domain-containing protein n=1 Tax=Halalkalibacterium halodurans TaxID=86665 RepID=A0A0M0KE82_ALKHA|nr:GntR family transcriptional regulator YhfZ [Halalkalibacterium halodurans]MED3645600.1 GntR family transcriptional regulator YhfZ [Halalkalibacterium halodurans]MED4161542.1 GntR family transcriptional regulator YhfZ [Halalkalibacterium halodurans]TPE69364.1 GntR family transcriptional regulator [Halalkalibacterium halodurans]